MLFCYTQGISILNKSYIREVVVRLKRVEYFVSVLDKSRDEEKTEIGEEQFETAAVLDPVVSKKENNTNLLDLLGKDDVESSERKGKETFLEMSEIVVVAAKEEVIEKTKYKEKEDINKQKEVEIEKKTRRRFTWEDWGLKEKNENSKSSPNLKVSLKRKKKDKKNMKQLRVKDIIAEIEKKNTEEEMTRRNDDIEEEEIG